jgi:L-threonylcarbamoyladenylate synthase
VSSGDPLLEGIVLTLDGGGVIGIPTDTVYGIACRPDDPSAVERIYAIKQRPATMELSLLGAEVADLATLAVMSAAAYRLAAAFWPGPLSLIVPARRPSRLAIPRTGDSVSIRVPDHDLLRRLLRLTGPLASTSANLHGQSSAVSAAEAVAALGDRLDAVLDGGPAKGRASTIIDLVSTPPRVLRTGPLSADELRPFLGG